MTTDAIARFAGYVATLGRGPGRSRALTSDEARDAMALLLTGQADPMQTGAFLMLLRYRGEDPDEMTGLVQAARATLALPGLAGLGIALDWPSYGAGRTRTTPWFVAAAMALGQAGHRVLMHGTNEFSAGMSVAAALAAIGRAPARTGPEAASHLSQHGLAYLPADALCPPFAALLDLRRLFGLRSPVNTAARLLNPADAPAGVDGVFHPPYIETHLGVAERMGRARLVVLKGGGGEAERNPAKPTTLHVWDRTTGRSEILAPAMIPAPALPSVIAPPEPDFAAIWRGAARHPAIEARIVATIALGLTALDQGGDAEAHTVWENRRRTP